MTQGNKPLPTPEITPVLVPMDAIQQDAHASPIVRYQSSEPGNSPPHFPIPDFIQEGSQTPPATPTRNYQSQNTSLVVSEASPDVHMPLAPPNEPLPFANPTPGRNTVIAKRPALPTQTHRTEPNLNAKQHILPPILDHTTTKDRLEAAANRSNVPAGRFTPRNPLDKYTTGPLPSVHDAHPTAIFEFLNVELANEWEHHKSGKVLAHPFDGEVQNPSAHETIRELIFTAASEITKSETVEVSAPKPSPEALKEGHYPSIFLIYNLTTDQIHLLLQRGVWSSQSITFRTLPFRPPCPNFMFSIKSFSCHARESILPIIQRAWDSPESKSFITALINAAPENKREGIETAIYLLMDSMWVQKLDIKRAGETLTPRFNVYTDSSGVSIDEVWIRLRNYLATCRYSSPMQGDGIAEASPYHCGVCHGVDHPRGLCPFPDVPGWNGPRKRPNVEGGNRRGNRGRSYGPGPRKAY